MTQVKAEVVSMWSSLHPPDREALTAGVPELHPLQGLAFFINLTPPLREENYIKTDAYPTQHETLVLNNCCSVYPINTLCKGGALFV